VSHEFLAQLLQDPGIDFETPVITVAQWRHLGALDDGKIFIGSVGAEESPAPIHLRKAEGGVPDSDLVGFPTFQAGLSLMEGPI